MDKKYIIDNIDVAIQKRENPTIVLWNRLEGRPRTHNFDKALKAEVRDALWMLTKQWQMGEFKSDDAGSPVFSKVHASSSLLNKYKTGNHSVQEFETDVPLEVKAEQKMIPFSRGGKELSIDIRLQMGRYWCKILKMKNLHGYISKFIEEYSFKLPLKTKSTDYVYAHKEVWQQYASISGRSVDGYKLYQFLKTKKVTDNLNLGINAADDNEINPLGVLFVKWFENLFYQPFEEKNNAWLPEKLEYQFQCSAPVNTAEKVITAEEYYQGHLDWYAFDINNKNTSLGNLADSKININKFTKTFIPTHVAFDGMPDTRWWKFEDSKTSFGDIKPASTDIAKLLLMEFGLVYANDWFIIPFELPAGSLAIIEGLTVTNNFGEKFWIEAAGFGAANNWKKWNMFTMKSIGNGNTQNDLSIFLAPAAIKVHESRPLEEVHLIRDEMANMVWGVETKILSPAGYGKSGAEAGLQTRQYHENLIKNGLYQVPPPYNANISYLAMTSVPENWIPFVPVNIKDDNRETQLQRSAMLRIIEGDPDQKPSKILPNTSLLQAGLDENKPYFLYEEEVPRAGAVVRQSFQRTRWTNGEVFVWLGIRKITGRGEGSSGLQFDQIVPV